MSVTVPESTWRELARRLAEDITAVGKLHTPAWRAVTRAHTIGDDGQPMIDLVAEDGSRAEITMTPGPAGYRVCQYGPQRLWDRVEEAVTFWHHEGRPSYDRFGITATPHDQHIWYDNPDGPHRWPL